METQVMLAPEDRQAIRAHLACQCTVGYNLGYSPCSRRTVSPGPYDRRKSMVGSAVAYPRRLCRIPAPGQNVRRQLPPAAQYLADGRRPIACPSHSYHPCDSFPDRSGSVCVADAILCPLCERFGVAVKSGKSGMRASSFESIVISKDQMVSTEIDLYFTNLVYVVDGLPGLDRRVTAKSPSPAAFRAFYLDGIIRLCAVHVARARVDYGQGGDLPLRNLLLPRVSKLDRTE